MSFSRILFFYFHLLTLWVGGALGAQSTQLFYQQFTTEDGLPSSEAYVVFEDQAGFIWIGTDNGVARYDGYEFEVFDSDNGLKDVVVFTILQDAAGRIWVGTYSGDAYYFDQGEFHPYPYNNVIQSVRVDEELVHLIDARQDGSTVFRLKESGVFRVDDKGNIAPILGEEPSDFFYYTPACKGVLAQAISPIKRDAPKARLTEVTGQKRRYAFILGNEVCYRQIGAYEVEIEVIIGSRWPIRFISVVNTTDGEKSFIYLHDKVIIFSSEGETELDYEEGTRLDFVLQDVETSFWAGYEAGIGLKYLTYDSRYQMEETSFFQGYSVSYLAKDRRGGLWVATTDGGVFYCPFPDQRKYSLNPSAKALAVAVTADQSFYAAYSDATIFQFDGANSAMVDVSDQPIVHRCDELFYDSLTNRLLSNFFHLEHIPDANYEGERSLERYPKFGVTGTGFRELNFSSKLGHRKALFANIKQVSIFDLDLAKFDFLFEKSTAGAYTFIIDSTGRYLIGTTNGLKELHPEDKENPIQAIDFGVKELNSRIIAAKEANGGLLFGTRGEGLVYLKDGKHRVIKKEDGLASNMVRDLEITKAGVAWVSTLNGISKVTFEPDTTIVRTFGQAHGLIDHEVHDICLYGDQIWLATSSGVQEFIEPPVNTFSPSPTIRGLYIDGVAVDQHSDLQINPGQHTIRIDFGTINFALGDKINYRFRLGGNQPWQYTSQPSVNFPLLSAGSYSFEVASENEDLLWSENLVVSFSIVEFWYDTIFAKTLASIIIIGLVSFYFYRRERKRRWEQNLLLQISKLEHEALHAQMNPHFVFNALNSIQNFVVHNDARQAATYLSRFALVIRQTLRSSVKGVHSLADEVSMLQTYLLLEKLRFKDGFNYQVMVSPSLDQDEIVLPPLLIQPFVENAILHGLSETMVGGFISITFRGNSHLLEVEIEDNGIGFEVDQTPDAESLGMEITRRRLEMMKGRNKNVSGMRIEPLYNEEGAMRGTKVVLWIYLDSQANLETKNLKRLKEN